MAQPFFNFLQSISKPQAMADILMRVKGAKLAARIIKGKIDTSVKDKASIMNTIDSELMKSSEFIPFMNIYKSSSFYSNHSAFANEVMRYL